MHLEALGKKIKEVVSGNHLAVVTDRNVAELYLSDCRMSLQDAGFTVEEFVVEPGEESKDGIVYLKLLEFLGEKGLTRTDAVVALGGGVVGDLAGFAAATFLRGIKVVQVPTTLLAMVDSSIGGKTGINLDSGKNLAGAFHQPVLVYREPELLESLPEEVFKDGMAEVIKYGVISDEGLFCWLSKMNDVKENLPEIIERCVTIKTDIVSRDELDKGERQLLNLGHTIGHAIEKAEDYRIGHGRAVAMGMAYIAEISLRQGWCSDVTEKKIRSLLEKYNFELKTGIKKETLYDIMLKDKKRKGEYIDLVIPREIGKSCLKRITIKELGRIL